MNEQNTQTLEKELNETKAELEKVRGIVGQSLTKKEESSFLGTVTKLGVVAALAAGAYFGIKYLREHTDEEVVSVPTDTGFFK